MAKSRPRQRRLKTELDPERLRVWLAYMRVSLQLTYEMNHQLLAESELPMLPTGKLDRHGLVRLLATDRLQLDQERKTWISQPSV